MHWMRHPIQHICAQVFCAKDKKAALKRPFHKTFSYKICDGCEAAICWRLCTFRQSFLKLMPQLLVPHGSPTVKIDTFHQDFVASTRNNVFQGQVDKVLTVPPSNLRAMPTLFSAMFHLSLFLSKPIISLLTFTCNFPHKKCEFTCPRIK